MSHHVAASLTLPNILQMIQPAILPGKKAASAAAAASGSGSPSTTTTSGGLDTTFLNLLVKELQNQDPTAPMDSTAMVGQMISLNQLDQLISINQKFTPATGTSAAAGAMTGATAVNAPAQNAVRGAGALTPPAGSLVSAPGQSSPLSPGGPAGAASAAQPIFGGFSDLPPISLDSSLYSTALNPTGGK